MEPYTIDPNLVDMKDELLEGIKNALEGGRFEEDDLPVILTLTLAVSYFHEVFVVAEKISRQLEHIN
jgi:hypothetical protein